MERCVKMWISALCCFLVKCPDVLQYALSSNNLCCFCNISWHADHQRSPTWILEHKKTDNCSSRFQAFFQDFPCAIVWTSTYQLHVCVVHINTRDACSFQPASHYSNSLLDDGVWNLNPCVSILQWSTNLYTIFVCPMLQYVLNESYMEFTGCMWQPTGHINPSRWVPTSDVVGPRMVWAACRSWLQSWNSDSTTWPPCCRSFPGSTGQTPTWLSCQACSRPVRTIWNLLTQSPERPSPCHWSGVKKPILTEAS